MRDSFVFGEWIPDLVLTPEVLREILSEARKRTGEARSMSGRALADSVDSLRALWDEGGRSRTAFVETQPERTFGLSRPMIERGLDHLARSLHRGVAERRAALQLGSPHGLRPEPLGVVLHVVSGNVFFGPCESLLAGLLTGNVNLVKRPGGSADFLSWFYRSLEAAAPRLAAATALLDWPGGSEGIEGHLGREVDGIVVAGDMETIAAYRRLASPLTALVEFGPRVSLAVVSRAALDVVDMTGLARDVALWDQLACTAAQCVYVQGETGAAHLAERLAEALKEIAGTLPEGEVSLDERIEIARFRDTAHFAEAMGRARVFGGGTGALATVVFEKDAGFAPSPLRRSVRVKPYEEGADLIAALKPLRGILQTVGMAVSASERHRYQECLSALGVRRFCSIGAMNEPLPEMLHDGTMELQRLTRWVEQ
jgi:hypothetical protein